MMGQRTIQPERDFQQGSWLDWDSPTPRHDGANALCSVVDDRVNNTISMSNASALDCSVPTLRQQLMHDPFGFVICICQKLVGQDDAPRKWMDYPCNLSCQFGMHDAV